MGKLIFPFTAIVGQDDIKKALILNLICPEIGGVLLAGEKGTAKSTIVRSLTQFIPDLKVVTLPLNATEDRVVGTLHIEKALKEGKKVFEPGILAEANGNILYIDEVNLLSNSLVDTILDAAASGVNRIEREGISYSHPSKFILVGSMNPEEGDLKPQLLDRFGLFIKVEGIKKINQRIEIIKKRLAFEENQEMFYEKYCNKERKLWEQILIAKEQLKNIKISNELLHIIVDLNLKAFVAGHRGDIVLTRAARALAAFKGRGQVLLEDIKELAFMVLAHRLRQPPVSSNVEGEKQSESEEEFDESKEGEKGREEVNESLQEQSEEKGDISASLNEEKTNSTNEKEESSFSSQTSNQKSPLSSQNLKGDQIYEIGDLFNIKDYLKYVMDNKVRNSGSGRRSKSRTNTKMGRYIKYHLPKGKVKDIALDATLRAAAPFQKVRDKRDLAITIYSKDIREKVREKRIGSTILFVVDASGSMGVQKRMEASKGAILSLLLNAYQKRDTVGMMIFRGQEANLILPPTRSVDLAYKRLSELPVGGKTPLALGLMRSIELMQSLRAKDSEIIPVIVLISDGRTNVSLKGSDPWEDVKSVARQAANQKIQFVVIDTETGFIQLGLAKKIAEELQGLYLKLDDLYGGR